MEFNEVKQTLKKKAYLETTLFPELRGTVLSKSLSLMEEAIEGKDVEFNPEIRNGWKVLTEKTEQVILRDALSEVETDFLNAVTELGLNMCELFEEFGESIKKKIRVIQLLLTQKRTIDQGIAVMLLLCQYLANSINDRNYENVLSDKFYKEYKILLEENKKEGKEDYRIQ